MNYLKIYEAFIKKYKNQVFEKDVYTEKHHIKPRHAGGDDSKENLIKLTYRQHCFAHRILWKAYGSHLDLSAWKMMTKQEVDSVVSNRKALGRKNVESGHLERIRLLINWDTVSRNITEINRKFHSDKIASVSRMKTMQDLWRGKNHTEDWKANKSSESKKRMEDPEVYSKQMEYLAKGRQSRQLQAATRSEELINNAERNEEFLQKTTSKSKYKFISPEGFEFDSPIFAAKYYGNIENYIVENWCKRGQYGWSRKPKQTSTND